MFEDCDILVSESQPIITDLDGISVSQSELLMAATIAKAKLVDSLSEGFKISAC